MKIDKFIKDIDINNNEYIIVGVSTGPDSMALLNMLQKNHKILTINLLIHLLIGYLSICL